MKDKVIGTGYHEKKIHKTMVDSGKHNNITAMIFPIIQFNKFQSGIFNNFDAMNSMDNETKP